MKVIQINVLYQRGSTGFIVEQIHSYLYTNGYESKVAYGRKKIKNEDSNSYKFCYEIEAAINKVLNRLGCLSYSDHTYSTHRLCRFIESEKPDVVHLHCINGYCVDIYKLLEFLSSNKIPTIVTHHAEFFYTANCGHAFECMQFTKNFGCVGCPNLKKSTGSIIRDNAAQSWLKMKKAFNSFDSDKLIFTAVSPWLLNRSQLSPIVNKYPCVVVKNGIDVSVFNPSSKRPDTILSLKYKIAKIVLHVTASFSDSPNSLKGGDKIIELAKMLHDIMFVVVASEVNIKNKLPANIYIWGQAKNREELAGLYSSADATVIASRRETFSMVVAESLCCGTPVVGFKAGGPESIALNNWSKFVDYGNLNSLKAALENILSCNYDKHIIANTAAECYSAEIMACNYLSLYKKITQ